MGKNKGFEKKQTPVAIILVVVVICAIVSVMVLGNKKIPQKESKNLEYKHLTQQVENTVSSKKNKVTITEKTTADSNSTPPEIVAPEEYTKKSSIIISGTRAMEMYNVSTKRLTAYAQIINGFTSKVPNSQVYVLLAPTSIEYYGPKIYNTGNHSQQKGLDIAYNALNDSVKKINIRQTIRMHTDEYIYFRTDHHWTARGAYYAYTSFAQEAGFKPTSLDTYKIGKVEGFVGSLYRYTQAQVLKDNPDFVETFIPTTNASGVIYSDVLMTNSKPVVIVSNTVKSSNKYLAFIQGDNPLTKITTDNKNGKKIIVIKESYGNSFAPFLIDNYEEVYVVDPRRIDMNLATFANENEINDVLFINYMFAPSNKTYMTALNKMLS